MEPQHDSGQSVTGALEGWFPNPDGSFSILLGYYNRNLKEELDIPIGPDNRIEPVSSKDAAQALMRHILFFAHEQAVVERVFDSVLAFVSTVKVCKLVFTPDARAWEVIR